MLTILYSKDAFKEMTATEILIQYHDYLGLTELLKRDKFQNQLVNEENSGVGIVALMKANTRAGEFVLNNFRLANLLEPMQLLEITHHCPDLSHLIYHKEYLLRKIRFDFGNLDPSIQKKVTFFLSISGLDQLSKTSRTNNLFFKPISDCRKVLLNTISNKSTLGFLQNRRLFLERGTIEEGSGRLFENISAFEYAYWARDAYLLNYITSHLTQEESQILRSQYQDIQTLGVTYRFQGKTITEQHFDLEGTLINGLTRIIEACRGGQKLEATDLWATAIGTSQKLLPVHLVAEYCANFMSLKQEYHFMHEIFKAPSQLELWFGRNSKLHKGAAMCVDKSGHLIAAFNPHELDITDLEDNLRKLQAVWDKKHKYIRGYLERITPKAGKTTEDPTHEVDTLIL